MKKKTCPLIIKTNIPTKGFLKFIGSSDYDEIWLHNQLDKIHKENEENLKTHTEEFIPICYPQNPQISLYCLVSKYGVDDRDRPFVQVTGVICDGIIDVHFSLQDELKKIALSMEATGKTGYLPDLHMQIPMEENTKPQPQTKIGKVQKNTNKNFFAILLLLATLSTVLYFIPRQKKLEYEFSIHVEMGDQTTIYKNWEEYQRDTQKVVAMELLNKNSKSINRIELNNNLVLQIQPQISNPHYTLGSAVLKIDGKEHSATNVGKLEYNFSLKEKSTAKMIVHLEAQKYNLRVTSENCDFEFEPEKQNAIKLKISAKDKAMELKNQRIAYNPKSYLDFLIDYDKSLWQISLELIQNGKTIIFTDKEGQLVSQKNLLLDKIGIHSDSELKIVFDKTAEYLKLEKVKDTISSWKPQLEGIGTEQLIGFLLTSELEIDKLTTIKDTVPFKEAKNLLKKWQEVNSYFIEKLSLSELLMQIKEESVKNNRVQQKDALVTINQFIKKYPSKLSIEIAVFGSILDKSTVFIEVPNTIFGTVKLLDEKVRQTQNPTDQKHLKLSSKTSEFQVLLQALPQDGITKKYIVNCLKIKVNNMECKWLEQNLTFRYEYYEEIGHQTVKRTRSVGEVKKITVNVNETKLQEYLNGFLSSLLPIDDVKETKGEINKKVNEILSKADEE